MTEKFDPVEIAQQLIRCPSVTPEEGGALTYLETLLKDAGFVTHRIIFEDERSYPVDNLYARYGTEAPHFCYAGHTDVVPIGDLADWSHGPFEAEIVDGMLYGRGAVDMKGSIACFAAAALNFLKSNPDFGGSISFLITGDEEADAINGTIKLAEWVKERGETIDACIVGEPTNVEKIGDGIKLGRRGSLSGSLIVEGIQGHVAYQHKAHNPIPHILPALQSLIDPPLDGGTEHFEPSNLEITSVDVGNLAKNNIPARVKALFNVRFNDSWTVETLETELKRRVADAMGTYSDYRLEFVRPVSENFVTSAPELIKPLVESIKNVTGLDAELSTGGGTSDARFMKNYCPVVEFGMLSDTIHQVDERTSVEDLKSVTAIFHEFLKLYFTKQTA